MALPGLGGWCWSLWPPVPTHLPEKAQSIEIAEKGPTAPHSCSLPVLSDHLTSFPFPQAVPSVWGGYTDLPGHAPSY